MAPRRVDGPVPSAVGLDVRVENSTPGGVRDVDGVRGRRGRGDAASARDGRVDALVDARL